MSKTPSARRQIDELADRLRLTREAMGLTQAAIARLAGISSQAWNNYETGRKRISVDQAIRLCIATGVHLDWIYRGNMHGLPYELMTKLQGSGINRPKKLAL